MIIDDDPDDIAFFCEALSEIDASIKCVTAYGGEQALEMLKASQAIAPDIIFMDLNMPRMNGKECLQCIKSDVSISDIPVVVYTTSKTQEDIDLTNKLGAVYFLTKPNKFDELKNAIEVILKSKWRGLA
jgi:CheY-like chemotaxis protein